MIATEFLRTTTANYLWKTRFYAVDFKGGQSFGEPQLQE
jgi:hypothetical protein